MSNDQPAPSLRQQPLGREAEQKAHLDDALRSEFGFTQDAEVNHLRLQQATDFLHAVNSARQIQVNTGAEQGGWRVWFERAVAATRTLVPDFGQQPAFSAVLSLVAVAAIGAVSWRLAMTQPDDGESLRRGTGQPAVWHTQSPRDDAARVAGALRGAGCQASVDAVGGAVMLTIDVSAPSCHEPEAILQPIGLIPDIHGHLTARVLRRAQ